MVGKIASFVLLALVAVIVFYAWFGYAPSSCENLGYDYCSFFR